MDKSQELALALLREAKEKGTLDPSVEKGLAELIGVQERPKIKEVLETPVAAEAAEGSGRAKEEKPRELTPEMAVYKQQYDSLPDVIKARSSWEAITERLMENNSEKLRLTQTMQGGGQLVGIDAGGKALFKDKGVEPVMYGFDEKGRLLQIYNRDPKQMKQVQKWADYSEIRGQILKGGYELFADDGHYNFSEEMQQVTDHTGEPFVASENREDWRVSWLESGDKPGSARGAGFDPVGGKVRVDAGHPELRGGRYGAARLLRV